MCSAFATTFPELQVATLPSHLFFLETSGFVNPRYMPVGIAGVMFAAQPVLFSLVGLKKLDPADVLGFTEVCFPGALHLLLTLQVVDVYKASSAQATALIVKLALLNRAQMSKCCGHGGHHTVSRP